MDYIFGCVLYRKTVHFVCNHKLFLMRCIVGCALNRSIYKKKNMKITENQLNVNRLSDNYVITARTTVNAFRMS